MTEQDEQRRKHAEYVRQYTAANNERINAQRRARRAANKEATLAREKAWREANHEKVLVYKKTDREKRPESYAEWKRQWAERNRETITEKKRADYAENKEEINQRLLNFRRANPEQYKLNNVVKTRRRRARIAELPHEPVDRDAIYERDGGNCQICGQPVEREKMSLDHVVPVLYGGPHVFSNLQLAHLDCNKARGAKGAARKTPLP